MLNFDRSAVKHALHNTQNHYHQSLSDSSRVQQIRFRPGLCRTLLGELAAVPRLLDDLRSPTSKGEEGKGKGVGEGDKGEGSKGDGVGKGSEEKVETTFPSIFARAPVL